MTYTWECQDCFWIQDVQRSMAERDKGPDSCNNCACEPANFKRTIEVPNFTRKTFLDGGRKSDKNFQDAKRALQLEVDSARSNSTEDRKLMSNEIKALRTSKK